MIYLIDDKRSRQEKDYGWTAERLEKYSDILTPVYTYEEMKDSQKREAIFSIDNIILLHESFFDNTINTHNKDSQDISADLRDFAAEKKIWVVFFSGSKNSCTLKDRVADIPVSVLYKNLEEFIEKVNENKIDLKYLLYGGKNPEIEEVLLIKLDKCNEKFDETPIISNRRNFLALTGNRINIPIILEGVLEKTFTLEENYDERMTDSYLNEKVIEWFSEEEVDNIFIPLCFGPSFSDYNGLQFACHIRCTDTINRLKPIFLYSFIDYSFMLNNEYFNLLKTKNVFLIDYSRLAFKNAILNDYKQLTIEELSKEIQKLKLDPPKNYEDSHSISNEWAIYRWSAAIDANDNAINKIIGKVSNQLYFKFLTTVYPEILIEPISKKALEIKYTSNPKILYIDDEANKGWFEIFCKIFCDINSMKEFDYLCEEFKSKTQDEIISLSMERVKENVDLVLLDFRLHPDDFNEKNIKNVTGLKLLQKIKYLNPGIQVIIFSATNKIWNLQALQEAGADGFIIKESPENSIDKSFTEQSINSFLNSIKTALKRRFLKDVFVKCKQINVQLDSCDYEDDSKYKEFLNDLKKQINLISDSSKRINLRQSTTLDIVFLNCYNFLEKFKDYYLFEVDRQFVLGIDEIEMNRYFFIKGKIKNEEKFFRINLDDNPSWFNVLSGIFVDYFKISKKDDKEIYNLNKIKNIRNDYIHNLKNRFYDNELTMILSLCEKITSRMRE